MGALISLIVILLGISTGISATYYVDWTGGNDAANGTSTGTAWKSISKVVSSSGSFLAGDSILLKRGETWRTNLYVAFSGTYGSPVLIADYGSGALPTIDVGGTNQSCIDLSSRSNVTVQNLQFQNSSVDNISLGGNTTNATFDGIYSTGATNDGFKINGTASATVINSSFIGNGDDGYSQHAGWATISNSVFAGNNDGIHNIGTSICSIVSCVFSNNMVYGVDSGESAFYGIISSVFDYNTNAACAILQLTTGGITNSTLNNGKYGVYFTSSTNVSFYVVGCAIGTNWTTGIDMENIGPVTLISNTFSGTNSFAVTMVSASAVLTNWGSLYVDCAGCSLRGTADISSAMHYGDSASANHYAYRVNANITGQIENCWVQNTGNYAVRSDTFAVSVRNVVCIAATSGTYSGSAATWNTSYDFAATIPTGNGNVRNQDFTSVYESTTIGNALFAVPKTSGAAYHGGSVRGSPDGSYFNGVLISGTPHIGANGVPTHSNIMTGGSVLRNAVLQ